MERSEHLELSGEVRRLVILGDPHGDLAGLEAVWAREGGEGVALFSVGDNVGYADGPASSAFCRRFRELGGRSVTGNHEHWQGDDDELMIVIPPRPGADLPPRARWRLEPEVAAWSRALPHRLELKLAGWKRLRIVLRHTIGPGWGYVHAGNAAELANDERADLVFVGHSHGPCLYQLAEGERRPKRQEGLSLTGEEVASFEVEPFHRYVVGAGSLARPGYHPEPPVLELATYATLDLEQRSLAIHALTKPSTE